MVFRAFCIIVQLVLLHVRVLSLSITLSKVKSVEWIELLGQDFLALETKRLRYSWPVDLRHLVSRLFSILSLGKDVYQSSTG